MTNKNESVLAVIGGGRWGQEILSILGKISVPFDRVVSVSTFNAHEINQLVKKLETMSSTSFSLIDSIDSLLNMYDVKAAIIVNSARQHFETARRLIEHKAHVLIEKPIVLSSEEMQVLLRKSRENAVFLCPSLCYQFCTYLDNFSEIIFKYGVPARFTLEWHDMANEIRYGKAKTFDRNINIAQDVMPHVWTILAKIFRDADIHVNACLGAANDYAHFEVAIKNITGHITLKRNANARARSVSVNFKDENFLKLDFSAEPGVILTQSEKFSADASWNAQRSPLTKQIMYFFNSVLTGKSDMDEAPRCVNSVGFLEAASTMFYAGST